jgi:PilZ domain
MSFHPLAIESPGTNRRELNRRSFQGQLEIEWGSFVLTGSVTDISPSGLFFVSLPPLWIGASFSARLMLELPLTLQCTVRRVEPRRGIGLCFALADRGDGSRFDQLLDSLSLV